MEQLLRPFSGMILQDMMGKLSIKVGNENKIKVSKGKDSFDIAQDGNVLYLNGNVLYLKGKEGINYNSNVVINGGSIVIGNQVVRGSGAIHNGKYDFRGSQIGVVNGARNVVGGSNVDMPEIVITVMPNMLGSIVSNGSIDIDIKGIGENTSVSLSGSGDLYVNKCTNVEVHSNGSSDVDIRNAINVATCTNGSGDITIASEMLNTVIVTSNGSGDIKVKARQIANLRAQMNGSGDLDIIGDVINENIMASRSCMVMHRNYR